MAKQRNQVNWKWPPPKNIIIDPVNSCNLHCSFCPTGAGKLSYKKTIMSFATFKKIIRKMPQVKRVFLFNWGEPFLNPDLFAMIKYAKKRSICISVDSNFSLRKRKFFFKEIIHSQLDYLRISLDGANQATYSRYRKGGDFNLVINNIKTLTLLKKEFRSRKPDIIWKFIVNRFNEKEIIQALKISLDLGVKFTLERMGLGNDLPDVDFNIPIDDRKKHWLPKNRIYIFPYFRNNHRGPLHNGPCLQLFKTIIVNPDGKVSPCCYAADKNSVFGDLLADSFYDIWHNEKYKFSRSLFTGEDYSGPITQTVCLNCRNFKKRTERSNFLR